MPGKQASSKVMLDLNANMAHATMAACQYDMLPCHTGSCQNDTAILAHANMTAGPAKLAGGGLCLDLKYECRPESWVSLSSVWSRQFLRRNMRTAGQKDQINS